MARSRSSDRDEVIADSEEEDRAQPKPKKTVPVSEDEQMADADEQEGGADSDETESEYEIEAILNAEMGMFTPSLQGEYAYFVSWKGYPAEENSWVSQEDAGNAMELIEEYWKTRPKKEAAKPSSNKKRGSVVSKRESSVKRESTVGRGRKSVTRIASDDSDIEVVEKGLEKARKSSVVKSRARVNSPKTSRTADSVNEEASDDDIIREPVKKAKTNGKSSSRGKTIKEEKDEESDTHAGTAVDGDDEYPTLPDLEAYMHQLDWEQLIEHVDTVEMEADGTLRAYVTLDNGKKASHDMSVVRQRCPQKLINFYESHLRWRHPHA
ncbi:hypothetical protein CALVIDRAFT_21070 [Calocera viscosa TUFC12733]|uniref:Chromo domain-containing protein n=1 Tax=Calocera viscosa (strain TUFC12733) TaxID=1330018 RepID=A0A167SGF1_CALVF|nr:hypothetical protein CALVIDRAFT_21070 [Calocera viscosa TUFC12733]